MWNSSLGCRVLRNAEARLIASAAWSLIGEVRNAIPSAESKYPPFPRDVELFDRMTPEQQVVMVDRVTSYLLDPKVAAPRRTALLDATIATIFRHVLVQIEIEIDDNPDFSSGDPSKKRSETIEALYEIIDDVEFDGEEPLERFVEADCIDVETWQVAVEVLRNRVLPDEDWALDELALDLPPEQGESLKQVMGINNDYFIDTAPNATVADAREAWCNLLERLTGHRPESWRFGDQPELVPEDVCCDPPPPVLSFSGSAETKTTSKPVFPVADKATVRLGDAMDQIAMTPSAWDVFLHLPSGQLSSLPHDLSHAIEAEMSFADYGGEADEKMFALAQAIHETNHYVEVPSNFDFH
ncbi:hypothetical protein RMSM_07079, partial [Rhodopirellula maiorica SM1]